MGVFAESTEKDVEAITWVANLSIQAWDEYKHRKGRPLSDFTVGLNDALVPSLSELGDKILGKHFRNASFLDRVSTLLVLANCFQFFTLSKSGRPVTSIPSRREFFARLTCAFVNASLILFKPSAETGKVGIYRFHGIKDEAKRERFSAFLQMLDPAEIAPGGKQKPDAEERALRTFARDILSVANFLELEIEYVEGEPEGTLEIDFPTGAEGATD